MQHELLIGRKNHCAHCGSYGYEIVKQIGLPTYAIAKEEQRTGVKRDWIANACKCHDCGKYWIHCWGEIKSEIQHEPEQVIAALTAERDILAERVRELEAELAERNEWIEALEDSVNLNDLPKRPSLYK
jgi:hypothetical protein